jgi:general stress protein 26
MEQQKTKNEVLSFLNDHAVAVLATISNSQAPIASAMYFTVDDNFNFFFLTKSTTRKSIHMQENGKVAIVVVAHNSPISVQVEGIAHIVSDPMEHREALNQIAERSARQGKKFWPPPVSQLQDGEMIIFKVTPTMCCYCDFFHGKPGKAHMVQITP